MITEKDNVNSSLIQQVEHMNNIDLLKFRSKLLSVLTEKLTDNERNNLELLLVVEYELTNREEYR